MKIYALFLDIDNTLYYNGKVPKRNVDALAEARKLGHFIFLNTARSMGFIPKEMFDEVPLDGAVAGIGTDLRFRGKQIFHNLMSQDECFEIAKYFRNDSREVGFEGEDTVVWMNPRARRHAKDILENPADFYGKFKNYKINKMYVEGALSDSEMTLFGKKYIMYRRERYSEFCPKGFGKAEGMFRMLDYLNLPGENSIAFGDSANDEDMLKAAGISVAMGNAIPEIKKICDFVSCDAKDGGVGEAVEKLLLNK